MDVLRCTRDRSPELADYLERVCRAALSFEGDHPLQHSSDNHVHLWLLEYLADKHDWIDTDYRTAFVEHVFAFWKGRLKGLAPYRERGYRMYVYEDLAPTVSVVAETDHGCPYGASSLAFVGSAHEVMALYEGRCWREHFSGADWEISPDRVLRVVEMNKGSIGKPTASRLGLKVGALRVLIANMGLEDDVNEVRRKNRRRPADFSSREEREQAVHIHEVLLRSGYR